MSASGRPARHRRRTRFALPALAAGLAGAVALTLTTTSAGAAPAAPNPVVTPDRHTVSRAELLQRVAGAVAGDDTPGKGHGSAQSGSAQSGSAQSGSTRSGDAAPGSRIDPKIIGGVSTGISTAPWMAQLFYTDDRGTSRTSDDIGFFCGGAVVAPTKILTAAHCVKGYNWHAHGAIVTGTAQLATGSDLHGGTLSGVWRQWNHPSYNAVTYDNDMALLTLPNPVKAKPIPMTTASDTASYQPGTTAKVYGWGRTSSTSQAISPVLKSASLPIRSDTVCSGAWGGDYVKGHMVCAGLAATGSDTGTTTPCNGDSGGPLVVGGRIVGVVSWGVEDCVAKGAYGVFSKVGAYAPATYPRVDDTDISGDGRADLWLRRKSDQQGFSRDSKGSSFGAAESWGSWKGANLVVQTDLNRDGYQDLLYRLTGGQLIWSHYVPSSGTWANKTVTTGWSSRKQILVPGDLTGDTLPDLVSLDSANNLLMYAGRGDGTFSGAVKIATRFSAFNQLRGHGDFSGDGKADMLARSGSGSIYLYRGTGSGGRFTSGVKVGSWPAVTTVITPGDVTGDGRADMVAVTKPGNLYLYKGTGSSGSAIFATPVKIGTGYGGFDLFS
ncbi:trypsin-like serine protease [Streptomyces sp. NPDC048182]|uniref:trypsin-like serine protease n=1 Tax=Streptomyces sp. NPDC048182 TaxID=3365507 RepID=UPI00372123E0